MKNKILLRLFAAIFFSSFCILHSAFCLSVENGPATNITSTNAWLVGNLVSTNATNTTLTCYYGAGNGGTNPALWQYSNQWGTATSLTNISILTTNLTPATWYYYRWRAVGTSTAWAAVASNFTTLATLPTNFPAATGGVYAMTDTNGVFLFPSQAVFKAITLAGIKRTTWPEHGTGDVATWSYYPATQDVDIAGHGIIFGGVTRTNWPVDATEVTASNAALGIRVGTLEVGVSNLQSSTSNNLGTNWSGYPATQTVDLAFHGLILGGVTRTNWPSVDASDWSIYPANDDVDIANRTLYNVAWIELGGVIRSSWPEPSSNWAALPASTNVNLAGRTISNGTFAGTIPALTNYSPLAHGHTNYLTNAAGWSSFPASTNVNLAGRTISNGTFAGTIPALTNYSPLAHGHTNYLTNAAGWSSFPATQTVNMANRGLANVSSIGFGGVTRTSWWDSAVAVPMLSIGPIGMPSPQLLNIAGVDGKAFINQAAYGALTSYVKTNWPIVVEEMEPANTNLHSWTNLSYIIDGDYTNAASGIDVGTKSSKPLRFSGWGTNIPANAVVTGIVFRVYASGRDSETHSAWLVQDGVTSSVQNKTSVYGGYDYSFGATTSLWGFRNITSGFSVDFQMGSHPYTFGHHVFYCRVEIYYLDGVVSWNTGVDTNGAYIVASGSYAPDIKASFSSNGISLSVPLSVPQITLGGETRTNWPAETNLAGGDVFLTSNNVFAAGTTQSIPSLILGTNAAASNWPATGAGTITNMGTDAATSIVWTASGGPQPVGSVTQYVMGRGFITNSTGITNASGINVAFSPSNYTADANVQAHLQAIDGAMETNRIALHGESNVVMRTSGTNVYFGAPAITVLQDATNALNAARLALQGATNALNSATGSLNTVVGNLGNATNALNTRAGNLETATNSLNTRAGNLETATNSLNANKLNLSGGVMTGPLTNIFGFYGDGVGLTNVAASVVYGTANNSAYRGDWGASVSGQVVTLHAATNALNIRAGSLEAATNALNATKLPLSGGTMTGPLTNIFGFYGDGVGLTNVAASVVYGTANNSAYRGDWGASVSGQVAVLNTNTLPLQSGLSVSNTASAALPKAGGTMTGPLNMGGQVVTNVDFIQITNSAGLGKTLQSDATGNSRWGFYSNPVSFQVGMNADFDFSTVATKVPWSVTIENVGNTIADGRFTPTISGKYHLDLIMDWYLLSATNRPVANLWKSGVLMDNRGWFWYTTLPILGDNSAYLSGSLILNAPATGEYYEVYVEDVAPRRSRYGRSFWSGIFLGK